jgi:predicted DCC family thiol-disulfide oxidoreductase YuxK
VLSRPVLLFDEDCGFCRTWVRRLRRWDRGAAIDYLPASARESRAGLPRIEDAAVSRAMHLILPDGRVLTGAGALPGLLPLLPGGRLLAPLLRIPGVQLLADQAYAWIAARRHRFGCGPEGCYLSE